MTSRSATGCSEHRSGPSCRCRRRASSTSAPAATPTSRPVPPRTSPVPCSRAASKRRGMRSEVTNKKISPDQIRRSARPLRVPNVRTYLQTRRGEGPRIPAYIRVFAGLGGARGCVSEKGISVSRRWTYPAQAAVRIVSATTGPHSCSRSRTMSATLRASDQRRVARATIARPMTTASSNRPSGL